MACRNCNHRVIFLDFTGIIIVVSSCQGVNMITRGGSGRRRTRVTGILNDLGEPKGGDCRGKAEMDVKPSARKAHGSGYE